MSFVLETTPRFSVVCVARRQLTPAPPPLSEAEGNPKLYLRLRSLFAERGVAYSELFHEATLTSEASVEARIAGGWTDTTLSSGAKAMLMRRSKAKDGDASYALCVLAADRKLDWKRLKKHVAKDLRLATQEEVFDASRCLPGAVPPFGSQFFLAPPIRTFMDTSLAHREWINFNCGLRTRSVRMRLETYLALEAPTTVEISSQA
mmetsp:Transcript_38629/g.123828  ORF Transcript_38629/g.123828 Transcript_38629/m.123828 type:complete len:205 (+) Transcript_38629:70-684(+)|eukprot:CAMPEP_0118899606 /NCGR_PEP_ID=MMETSP1166-20130328/6091_1 /TAXON_ID=1104430 /ORGANISM="Chrysoreinhardia sp, Strain CCMP3193" /LENGTH=204 /DNA_ID=CAMNT_0006838737 /DNA_START=45 /DNA_END=659 /DNA_ORIENTATION=+